MKREEIEMSRLSPKERKKEERKATGRWRPSLSGHLLLLNSTLLGLTHLPLSLIPSAVHRTTRRAPSMVPSIVPLALWVPVLLCVLASAKMDPSSYAPLTGQQCPQTLLRQPPALNQTISPSEVQYLADRRKSFPAAWRDWVGDGSQLGYNLDSLGITANNGSGLPIIAIASSGGGYRYATHHQCASQQSANFIFPFFRSAAQLGAGVISGLDARNSTAKAKGTGGLLQVSSYLAGLSGGSWLVSSMLFHDFPDMYDLVLGNTDKGGALNGWLLDKSLVLPHGINPFSQDNQYFWGYVVVSAFAILHISTYIHLSTQEPSLGR